MTMHSETRSGGNAPALPGSSPFGTVSRRAAMVGAVAAVGLKARGFSHTAEAVAPDAALIALAQRLEGLIGAEREAWDRHSIAEDAAFRESPPEPIRHEVAEPYAGLDGLPPAQRFAKLFADPTDFWAASAAADADHEAAMAEYVRAVAKIEKRHGVSRLERHARRLADEVTVTSAKLAEMQASTSPGIAAKARVLLSVTGADWMTRPHELERHLALLGSFLEDAARLGAGGAA